MTIVENRGQVPGAAQDVPLIEARGIIKHYDGFSLDNVSLSVGEGEVVGFVGKNGAGKSTTIKALLGLVKLDGGEGSILGVPSNELSRPVHAGRRSASVWFSTRFPCPGTFASPMWGAYSPMRTPHGILACSSSSRTISILQLPSR